MRLLRREAKTRGYDPEKIGALGGSAGSHLTVLLGTSALTPAYEPIDEVDDLPAHIQWAVPIYTAYALTDGLTGPNKKKGEGADVKLTDAFKFDEKTCPWLSSMEAKMPTRPSAPLKSIANCAG